MDAVTAGNTSCAPAVEVETTPIRSLVIRGPYLLSTGCICRDMLLFVISVTSEMIGPLVIPLVEQDMASLDG